MQELLLALNTPPPDNDNLKSHQDTYTNNSPFHPLNQENLNFLYFLVALGYQFGQAQMNYLPSLL